MASLQPPHRNHPSSEHAADQFLLNVPLQTAPIASLKSLESGDEHATNTPAVWQRMLMSLRSRRHASQPMPAHKPLRELPAVNEKREPSGFKQAVQRGFRRLLVVLIVVLCFFGIVHIANVARHFVPAILDDDPDLFLHLDANPGGLTGYDVRTYPTHLTADVTPKPCHSHNDYWRRVPLFDALHAGCTGVEADIWNFGNGELYVGHDTKSLTFNRTLTTLYIEPLVNLLDRKNPGAVVNDETKIGLFDDGSQTLVLLVDLKTSGPEALHAVSAQLSPLRSANYLSYFDSESNTVRMGPVTVVATGNAPFDLITSNTTHRDIFFDAPLADMFEEPLDNIPGRNGEVPPSTQLPKNGKRVPQSEALRGTSGQGTVGTTSNSTFDRTNSYYASVSFSKSIGNVWRGTLSAEQMRLLRGQIQGAKKRGLKVRYWGTPSWPVGLRNHIWDVLVKEGVDYLNGDDLKAMTRVDWTRKKHYGWF